MGSTVSKTEKDLVTLGIPNGERFIGLENFGNTCYCNSVLQALFFCQPFKNEVINYYKSQLPPSTQISGNSSNLTSGYISSYWSSKNNPKEDSLVYCLGELFHLMTQVKRITGCVAPKKFIERVKFENELFRSYMHQDAHEFLNFLLNSVAEYLQQQIKETHDKENSNSDSSKPIKKEDIKTFIHDIFEGTLTNETKCLTCESITNKDESFLDLSIDIEQNRSISSCLWKFSSVEVLSKNNKFFCDKCNSLQEAQKRMKIKKLPNTLIIHLKRFKFIESLQQYRKLNDRVVFPFEIIVQNTTNDIPNPDNKLYLFAITVHVGSGPNQGHYISFIKSNGVWIKFDDDNISAIPNDDDIKNYFGDNSHGGNECGYLLFYQTSNEDNRSLNLSNINSNSNNY